MKANRLGIALVGSVALVLAACRGDQLVAPLPDVTQAPPAATLPAIEPQTEPLNTLSTLEPGKDGAQMATPPASPGPSSGLESLIKRAQDDLAGRLSISAAQISLVEAKAMVWPDSSLGCARPGMRYKQVPEDGAMIILEAQGKVYEYHTGGSRGLFFGLTTRS